MSAQAAAPVAAPKPVAAAPAAAAPVPPTKPVVVSAKAAAPLVPAPAPAVAATVAPAAVVAPVPAARVSEPAPAAPRHADEGPWIRVGRKGPKGAKGASPAPATAAAKPVPAKPAAAIAGKAAAPAKPIGMLPAPPKPASAPAPAPARAPAASEWVAVTHRKGHAAATAAAAAEAKPAVPEFREGQIVQGTVRSIVPFGAFVTLAPHVDGLVHISQLRVRAAWRAELRECARAPDALLCGRTASRRTCRRLSRWARPLAPWCCTLRCARLCTQHADLRRSTLLAQTSPLRISLSIRAAQHHRHHRHGAAVNDQLRGAPADWPEARADRAPGSSMRLEVGAELRGRVVALNENNCFVDVGTDIDGCLHVSEVARHANQHIWSPAEALQLGQELTVVVSSAAQRTRRLFLVDAACLGPRCRSVGGQASRWPARGGAASRQRGDNERANGGVARHG
jgi:predicted RNA-binding protein with RPS1 domain